MLDGASAGYYKQTSSDFHTSRSLDQQCPHKRRRRDNKLHRDSSLQKGDSNNKPASRCRDTHATLFNVGFMVMASPSSGLTEEKFKNLIDYSNSLKVHAVVILEHQLSTTETPDYVSRFNSVASN
jgi:hypothetical protein